jgi:phosphoglycolate phosphatase
MTKLLLFDFDGTISDSINLTFAGYKTLNRQFNLPDVQTKADFGKFFETNFYQGAINAGLPREKIPEISRCYGDYLSAHSDEIEPFAGIKEVITELAKDNHLYIVTSMTGDVVKRQLERYGIDEFQNIYGAEQDTSKVKKICEISSLYPNISKDNIYMIGDTAGDIIEGKEAGVRTIAVSWGYHSRQLLEAATPDFIADTPAELLEYLSKD